MNFCKYPFLIATVLCFILKTQSACAQTNAQLLPKVIPPTPEVASLARFGSYPVNYFTGLTNIDIPLHEIVVGDVAVPIAISYHPSGIKVTDRATWVGLGWALSAGGNISRKVMGLPDELAGGAGYLNGSTVPTSEPDKGTAGGLLIVRNINKLIKDAEPDIYSYSFPGKSGRFVFNQQNNNKPVMIPYDPVLVHKTFSPGSLSLAITDEFGTFYDFGGPAESNDVSYSWTTTTAKTAWMLSKIIAKDKQDTIKFSYSSRYGQVNKDVTDYVTVTDLTNNPGNPCDDYSAEIGTPNSQTEDIYATEQKISEILFPLGKVVFESNTTRQDGFPGHSGGPAQKELDKIYVYNLNPATNTYTLQKTVEFHQTYFTSTDGSSAKRLSLDSLSIYDAASQLVQRYRFEYNTSVKLPDYLSKRRDLWGYYNFKVNSTLIPYTTYTYQACFTGCTPMQLAIGGQAGGRDPDPSYMQANILKKIIYPTGGSTEFIYETNQYLDGSIPKYAGGLRIKQIKSYDGINAAPLIKTFKYGTDESGYGRANFILNNYSFVSEVAQQLICNCSLGATSRHRTFGATANIELEPYDGSPVVYPTVTEYEGDELNNTGKTVYTFSDEADNLNTTFTLGTPVINSNHFKRGLLLSKSVYKRSGSTFQIIHKTENSYHAFSDSLKSSIGYKTKKTTLSYSGAPPDTDLPADGETVCHDDSDNYFTSFYAVNTGDNKLISSTETQYDQNNGSITNVMTTTYAYQNYLHQQPTQTSTTNGIGETHITTIKYPHEATGSVYTQMVQKRLLAYPVEEITTRNSVQLEKITRNYHNFSTYVFEPQTIYRQVESGANELEVTFSGYDIKGNVLGYTAKDNVANTYVWGYKKSFPIASVAGATSSQVFYNGFEEDYSGNVSTANSKTGSRSWYNTSYVAPIPSAGTYHLTYWKKVGSAAWEYVEATISSNTSIGGSGIYIDEVRIYPPGAKITTYTHEPGKGISSSTDLNSTTTYFEYDSFGRLGVVKDHNQNIVKSYKYNYINNQQ